MTVIWWVRRDLRLADNQALAAALARADRVVPVFVLDPVLLGAPDAGDKRVAFLFAGLQVLDAALRARHSGLVLRRGEPLQELTGLLRETGASAIYAEEDPWPYARRRDERVGASLPLYLVGGLTLHPADAIRKADGSPYTVFTPFSRAWRALPKPGRGNLLAAPDHLGDRLGVQTLPVPDEPSLPPDAPFPSGEDEAGNRLSTFIASAEPPIFRYADGRNRLDLAGTSQLSPYLRFGMVSARQAVVAAHEAAGALDSIAREGAEVWLNELIWREFYMAILHHFPDVLDRAFQPALREIRWANNRADFAAWSTGQTGYPVVDSAMRQLVSTGWMHNRARMIVASFLVKDLLVDWRWGERFFMQHLVDGDPAANNGGWQWTAGVGTDAAPYFRVFNPGLQGARYDPDGHFARRWVPELVRVPREYIHEPWRMPPDIQRAAGCVIGRDYPAPIVDHAWARERALAAYRR